MSARLSRPELAVLIDRLTEFIDDEAGINKMLPEYAFNLGVIRAKIEAIEIGLLG